MRRAKGWVKAAMIRLCGFWLRAVGLRGLRLRSRAQDVGCQDVGVGFRMEHAGCGVEGRGNLPLAAIQNKAHIPHLPFLLAP
eukprot:1094023-Rhodomonas_salina.1